MNCRVGPVVNCLQKLLHKHPITGQPLSVPAREVSVRTTASPRGALLVCFRFTAATTGASSCPPAPRSLGKHVATCRDAWRGLWPLHGTPERDGAPIRLPIWKAGSKCSGPQGSRGIPERPPWILSGSWGAMPSGLMNTQRR